MLFQSTHLHEVRPPDHEIIYFDDVSIHAPARGATINVDVNTCGGSCFNPRTCTRCDTCLTSDTCWTFGFNPRTCTRCDVTSLVVEYVHRLMFQSTHLHEVRQNVLRGAAGFLGFNPRTCTRCDHNNSERGTHMDVSIHAPARGATYSSSFILTKNCFNPRTCTRCDSSNVHYYNGWRTFQSTHLHEVRLLLDPISSRYHCFNPRTCTRCDKVRVIPWRIHYVSIHAPARGATQVAC